MAEDFSLKWFGIPDVQVVAFWDRLSKYGPVSKERHKNWRANQQHIAAVYEMAKQGNPAALRWVREDHLSRITR